MEELIHESGYPFVDGFELTCRIMPVVDERAPEIEEVVVIDFIDGPKGDSLQADIKAVIFEGH